ncbi:MAG: hypothetical protein J5932_00035 [Prevotella sp.]|nr:hypothetical protein [Prevotella sp.]
MIQRKFRIKDGVLLETTEVRIEDYSKLLKYNMNLRKLADDIRRSRNDEHFENYLLKAEELFAEEIAKAKVLNNPVFGSHSVFYYMSSMLIKSFNSLCLAVILYSITCMVT